MYGRKTRPVKKQNPSAYEITCTLSEKRWVARVALHQVIEISSLWALCFFLVRFGLRRQFMLSPPHQNQIVLVKEPHLIEY